MSTVNGAWRGPNIVRDGLVLYLNAASPTSYNSIIGGTTWKDLSGNGNNGTMTNGAYYTSSNGGAMVFDGIDEYVSVPNTGPLSSLASLGTMTVTVWVKANTTAFNQTPIMLENSPGADSSEPFRFYLYHSANFPAIQVFNNSENFTTLIATTSLATGTYYNLTAVCNATNILFYINGTLSNQTSFSGPVKGPGSGTAARWIIGSGELPRGPGDRKLNGDVGLVQIYNRVLSTSEVLQNFNSTRSRFGI
jgi:hypothetical protein